MRQTKRFSLSKHSGARETWPLTSRLLADGKQTNVSLPGYEILDQFEGSTGYLIVTDYDCPFQETVNFVLLDHQLHELSRQSIGTKFSFVPTGTAHILKQITWDDDWHFHARFHGDTGDWRFAIRRFHVPLIYPQLTMDRVPLG